MKNVVIYIVGLLLIIMLGLFFDYVENGSSYSKSFDTKKQSNGSSGQLNKNSGSSSQGH